MKLNELESELPHAQMCSKADGQTDDDELKSRRTCSKCKGL